MIAYEKMNRRILHITFYSDINSVLFPRKSTGFTLVEIVVLLLVAAIILPALILPFSEGTRKLELPVIMNTLSFLGPGGDGEKYNLPRLRHSRELAEYRYNRISRIHQ